MSTVLVALIGAAATIISALIAARKREPVPVPRGGGPWSADPPGPYASVITDGAGKKISWAVILGAVSLVAWILPFIGLPVALLGIGAGVSDIASGMRKSYARTGIYLALLGLIAAVANSAIGAYLGAHGQLG